MMMKLIFACVVGLVCVHTVYAGCNQAVFESDPTPWGGGACITEKDCGGLGVGSKCDNGTCICSIERASPDCSRERIDHELAGALNIGLPFAGVAGVGQLVAGNIAHGVGQLLLFTLSACIVGILGGCFGLAIMSGGDGGDADEAKLAIFPCLICICVLSGFIWSLVDGVALLHCDIPDGDGYGLY